VRASRITKIAGLSLAGFVASTVLADKINPNPLVSQVAGFTGAFLGTLVGGWRARRRPSSAPSAGFRNRRQS
jgi:hypothetical protein